MNTIDSPFVNFSRSFANFCSSNYIISVAVGLRALPAPPRNAPARTLKLSTRCRLFHKKSIFDRRLNCNNTYTCTNKLNGSFHRNNFTFNFCFSRTRPRFVLLDHRLFPLLCCNKRGTGLISGTRPLVLRVALGACRTGSSGKLKKQSQ